MLTASGLPDLNADEAAHASRVAAHLRAAIAAAGGWLPFSEYMRLALYAPGLGYYSAGARRFGPAGDFVTAPELTPLFARCVATQVAEILAAIGGGTLVEVGGGSGALAAELLATLAARGDCPERYEILEVSASLRAEQHATIAARAPELLGRVAWIDQPPASPWRGVLVANEVLDALPVERFRATAEGVELVGVAAQEEGFGWVPRPADEPVATAIAARLAGLPEPLPTGYVSEASLWVGSWVAELAAGLGQGVMLFVDYGLPRVQYYHPSRDGGTACGFFRHRRVDDVLARPGLQDITAWVDFTAVAEAASACGLEVAGFTTQAHFLLGLGLAGEIEAAAAGLDAAGRARVAQAAGTLMLPGEMGERFKVIALSRGMGEVELTGFAFRDLAGTL